LRPETWTLGLMLAATATSGVLAWQAWGAARSHQAVVEQTLEDHARAALWRLAEASEQELRASTNSTLMPLHRHARHAPGTALPSPDSLSAAALEECGCPGVAPLAYFRVDSAGAMRVRVGTGLQLDTAWLGLVPRPAGTTDSSGRQDLRALFRDSLVAFALRSPAAGDHAVTLGLVTSQRELARVVDRVIARRPLVAPALAAGAPTDSLLDIVLRVNGTTLRGDAHPGARAFAARDTLPDPFGQVVLDVAVRPAAAARLVIGGLPRSRLPLLLILFATSVALAVTSLRQLKREQAFARQRTTFAAGVSHELRTPVAKIQLYGQMLLLDRVRSERERQQAIEVIGRESQRLGHLLDRFFRFTLDRRVPEALAAQREELATLVQEIVDGYRPLAEAAGATLHTRLEAGLTVPVDREDLHSVLVNLLDNAVKYGPPGQDVMVEARRADGWAHLAVTDQGPGIPPQDRGRVWQPFTRLPEATRSGKGGTGIGLAVVRSAIERHGGRVSIDAAPSGGARVVVLLPGARGLDVADPLTAHATT